MNCVMNGKLADEAFAGDVFVQPAAADNGASLGAALLLAKQYGSRVTHKMEHAYWGPAFDDGQIEQALKEAKIDYRRSGDVSEEVAAGIERGAIVGWFQGRMEVGARALGGRSILANPLLPEMKDRLNLEVKHREDWRPFCPSMTQEAYDRIIGSRHDSPFMILAFPVVEMYRESLPSVVHVDGTARPQVVKEEHSPAFFRLLKAFERRTGHAVLVNTSFNVQGEPIVCTPRDAIRCFGATGIDLLAIGNFIAEKPGRVR
jgi:carbamoyltransferase